MTPIFYFLMILVIQLLFATYFRIKYAKKQSSIVNEEEKQKDTIKLNTVSNATPEKPTLRRTVLSEAEKELKRNRTRLRRNLLTLNYISSLESETEALEEVESFTEVINLKRRLQREVIRNTRLVRHYSALL
jgi:hypothetical protein